METSFFVPKEKLLSMGGDPAMNGMVGAFVFGVTDPGVVRLLPPPLALTNPEQPVFYAYIVNIREPTFAPWYMEGGIGVLATYGGYTGVYFFGLQLSGPGAEMGLFTGREGSGLPKKLCERIAVERTDDWAHGFIERKGVRLLDIELDIGQYDVPETCFAQQDCRLAPGGFMGDGGCLLHKYQRRHGAQITDMELIFYDSPTRYHSWEPAKAKVRLQSSIDDPWGEIPLRSVFGAAWSQCDNIVRGEHSIYRYEPGAEPDAMQYLFTGRYDRCVLCHDHQRYEG